MGLEYLPAAMVSKEPDPRPEIPDVIDGLRMTKQRKEIYHILTGERTHPTANEVFMKAKEHLPNISLATVYNCLEALVEHKVIRQVNFERESSRYCPNLRDHVHFHDNETGTIHDVNFKKDKGALPLRIPKHLIPTQVDISIRGHCSNPVNCPNRAEN